MYLLHFGEAAVVFVVLHLGRSCSHQVQFYFWRCVTSESFKVNNRSTRVVVMSEYEFTKRKLEVGLKNQPEHYRRTTGNVLTCVKIDDAMTKAKFSLPLFHNVTHTKPPKQTRFSVPQSTFLFDKKLGSGCRCSSSQPVPSHFIHSCCTP